MTHILIYPPTSKSSQVKSITSLSSPPLSKMPLKPQRPRLGNQILLHRNTLPTLLPIPALLDAPKRALSRTLIPHIHPHHARLQILQQTPRAIDILRKEIRCQAHGGIVCEIHGFFFGAEFIEG